jgi:Fic family protein
MQVIKINPVNIMTKKPIQSKLKLVSPSFNSKLLDSIMELNYLRRSQLHGTTSPYLFFQLKKIFHLLESVGSARIEGNRTTISEYIETKIEEKENSTDTFMEISNVERAMEYIEQSIKTGTPITNHFIRELHQLTVSELNNEGDKTPGAYRSWQVSIAQSEHMPPEPHMVQSYMDELLDFINDDNEEKFDLIKAAITHHRFVWIHPFGNGNGRVVRLLTYALLIKYGFRVQDGQLLNPTAVFCNNRDMYYKMLSIADIGTDDSMLQWCEYVLTGVSNEISKINKLLDYDYLLSNILKPSISKGRKRELITTIEEKVLNMGVTKQTFKSADIAALKLNLSTRQITLLISNLKSRKLISPTKEKGREYYVSFYNNYLMRSLIQQLESESFIPPID